MEREGGRERPTYPMLAMHTIPEPSRVLQSTTKVEVLHQGDLVPRVQGIIQLPEMKWSYKGDGIREPEELN